MVRYSRVLLLLAALMLVSWLMLSIPVPDHGGQEVSPPATVKPSSSRHRDAGLIEPVAPLPESKREAAANPITLTETNVFGKVLRKDGREAAGAEVFLSPAENDESTEPIRTLADEKGAFSILAPPPGRYLIYARQDQRLSFARRRDIPRVAIEMEAAEVGPITLYLQKTHALKLRVVSAETGKPLPGAEVRLLEGTRELHVTDGKGEVWLRLSPQIWKMKISAPGHVKSFKVIDFAGTAKHEREVALDPAGVCFGTVTDPDGRALAGARVSYRGWRYGGKVETDAHGRFWLDHLPFHQKITVFFHKRGYNSARRANLEWSPTNRERELSLALEPVPESTGILEGVVLDREGLFIANARVFTVRGSRETFSGTDGSFRLPLSEKLWRNPVWAEAKGYASARVRYTYTKETLDKVKIVLEKAHWLKGRVVDTMGLPLAGVSIYVVDAKNQMTVVPGEIPPSNGDGTFHFEALPPRINLRFRAEGFSTKMLSDVTLNRDDLEVVLAGEGVIRGQVVAKASGQPIPRFNIKVRTGDQNRRARGQASLDRLWSEFGVDFQSDDGAFLLDGLQVGQSLYLLVSAPDFPLQVVPSVNPEPESQAAPLLIELEKDTVTVGGVVIDSQGKPRPETAIQLLGFDTDHSNARYHGWAGVDIGREPFLLERTAWADGRGRFLFEKAPADLGLHLYVNQAGLARTQVINIHQREEEARKQLVVTVPDEARILVVLNRKRFEVDGVSCFLMNTGRPLSLPPYAPEGDRVILGQLGPGDYRVQAMARKKGDAERTQLFQQVTLAEGETKEIRLGFEDQYRVEGHAWVNGQPMASQLLVLVKQVDGIRSSANMRHTFTDGEGYFFFETEPGSYELVALGSTTWGLAQHLAYEHPNRVSIEVEEQDSYGHYDFQKIGALSGRLVTEEVVERVSLIGYQRGLGWRFTPVDEDGRFRLEQVPPETYVLQVNFAVGGLQPYTFQEPVVMPEDGSDLDLGDLYPLETGSLNIHFHGDTSSSTSFYVQVFPLEIDPSAPHGQMLASGHVQDFHQPLFIENIPTGPVRLHVAGSPAWVSDPPELLTEVFAGQITELEVTVQKVTFLAFHGPKIEAARLAHQESDMIVDLTPFPEDVNYRDWMQVIDLSHFSGNAGLVRNVPEGKWKLTVVGAENQTATRVVQLARGREVELWITFD